MRRTREEQEAIARQVFEAMRDSTSAYEACKKVGIPQSTLGRWVEENPSLSEDYARAREDMVERMAAELLNIADSPVGSTESGATDSGAVAKQRLQVDARKWILSKIAPRKYGEKLELAGDPDRPIGIQKIERVIVANPKTSNP